MIINILVFDIQNLTNYNNMAMMINNINLILQLGCSNEDPLI